MAFEFKLPDIGEGVVEGEIVRWLVQEGQSIEEDQPMVEVMTDKATVEISSPVAGKVMQTVGAEGDVVEVGSVMIVIESVQIEKSVSKTEQVPPKTTEPEVPLSAPARQPAPGRSNPVLATPAVRKYARERKIDLRQIEGTGPGGRITREDVDRPVPSRSASPASTSQRAHDRSEDVRSIPYRGLRKKIGDHMVASKRFAPHFTYVEEVDVTQLVALRREYNRAHPDARLTYLPFLIKAVVHGLKQYPILNSTLDEDKQVIQLKKDFNIGLATATHEGLVVPVIRNVDGKSLIDLAAEIAEMAEKTKQGRVKLEDLKDGTFTITSLGFMGGVLATPIINYPEVAILGVHKIAEKPVVREGRIVIREMMNLSLSLDHRVVDGVIGAQFMHAVIPVLQNPGLLALG